jgi:hypothetical protein
MLAAWRHPAAAIDVDQLYLTVDAHWELPYDNRRNAMVLSQATHLASSLFEHGWRTVIICGNGLLELADTAPILATLSPVAQIYHITLTPPLQTTASTRCRPARSGTARINPGQAVPTRR